MGQGYLTVKASMANEAVPLEGASVVIKDAGGNTLYTLTTDTSGKTAAVALPAPDRAYTLDPGYRGETYSTYRVEVRAPGFVTEIINGVQIFDTQEALEEVEMHPGLAGERTEHIIDIPPHKQMLREPFEQQGRMYRAGRAMQRVIIPDFITVHLGRYDQAARNIRVPFPLYVKNVASSEIYPSWAGSKKDHSANGKCTFSVRRW